MLYVRARSRLVRVARLLDSPKEIGEQGPSYKHCPLYLLLSPTRSPHDLACLPWPRFRGLVSFAVLCFSPTYPTDKLVHAMAPSPYDLARLPTDLLLVSAGPLPLPSHRAKQTAQGLDIPPWSPPHTVSRTTRGLPVVWGGTRRREQLQYPPRGHHSNKKRHDNNNSRHRTRRSTHA